MSSINNRHIVHTAPLFRYAILIIIGIVLGDYLDIKLWLLLMSLTVMASALSDKKWPMASSVLLLLSLIGLGGVRIGLNKIGDVQVEEEKKGAECGIAILTEPVIRGKVLQFDGMVCNDDGEDNMRLSGHKVRLSLLRDTITGKYKSLHIGDGIRGMVDLSPLRNWSRVNEHFNYIKWLKTRGFAGRGFVGIGKWEKMEIASSDIGMTEHIKLQALVLRQNILKRIEKSGIEHDAFAVATAMSLGNKAALTPELREEYSISGASHVLALSGVHLSIIYMILTFILRTRRWWGVAFTMGTIWAYVMFTGMPISVLRAACMLTIWEILRHMSHDQKTLNVLGATACIMVMWTPQCVWDVGFQMSFAAVLAIILLMEPFRKMMPKAWRFRNKKEISELEKYERAKYYILRSCWFTVAVSISAQLGTMPLTAYYFGRISVYFILTNLIAVPAVTVIVVLTMIMAVIAVADIIGGVGNGIVIWVLGKVLGWFTGGFNWVLRCIAELPGASIEGVRVTVLQILAWYVILFVGVIWVNRKVWR